MSAQDWKRVKGIFQDALERRPQERAAWLGERCGGDFALQAEVESLLAAHADVGSFAAQPAVESLEALGADNCSVNRRLQPGDRLDVYEIEGFVGAGGMGEVYAARDTRLDRTVAIKVLPPHLAADRERYRRFEREARAIARLDHPHIGSLYDVGEHEGRPFLVMQYLGGETLAARLVKGALPLDQALRYAIEIADALDHAHRRGLVHRDLKPGNIVLNKSSATLLDFGLAKWRSPAIGSQHDQSASQVSDSLTDEGVIAGTLHYMAPEQVEGKPVDPRTDIFAFGALLYEMTTGRKAFDGDSTARVMAATLGTHPPSIATLEPLAPAALGNLVGTSLAKDPDERWQSAGDVARQLRWIAESTGSAAAIAAATEPRADRGVSRRAAIAWLAAGLVGGAFVWSQIHGRSAPPLQITRSVLMLRRLLDYEVTLSPDGTRIAYVVDGPHGIQLYLQSLNEFDAKMIAEDGCCPFFSPDSRWLGFTVGGRGEGGLKKVPVSGGVPQVICDKGAVFGATWGSDGTIVFTPSEREGLHQVRASGGSPRVLTTLEPGEMSHRWPQFLPGSKAAVFTIKTPDMQSYAEARVGVVSLETRDRHVVLTGGTNPQFVATGDLLYVHNGSVVAVPFDLRRLETTGHSVTVLDDVNVGSNGYAQFSVADNGLAAYVRRDPRPQLGQLTWVDRNGSRAPLTDDARVRGGDPRLSPDGQRLALTSTFEPNDQVWTYDLARRTFSRLTTNWNNTLTSWTPDGKRIMFLSDRDGPFDLYWQVADGSKPAERLTANPKGKGWGAWSPDARVFLFTQTGPMNRNEIWSLTIRSGSEPELRPFIQTSASTSAPAISPDGHWLAFTSNETGRSEVYVQPFPDLGAKWQVSSDGATTGPRWEPVHGRELYYRKGDRMMMVAVRTRPTFAAAAPRVLFEGPYDGGFAVARDGRFLMVERGPEKTDQIALVQNWLEEMKQNLRRPLEAK